MKPAKLQETKSTIRFSAKLFRPKATEKIGLWTLLTLPKNASAKLPSRGMTMVEGTIKGFPFRAALEPNGKGSHWFSVNKAMHDAAGADAGDTARFGVAQLSAVQCDLPPFAPCSSILVVSMRVDDVELRRRARWHCDRRFTLTGLVSAQKG
jgi:hypothetical protein